MPTSTHATISNRKMKKELTIKISELVFPAIAKRKRTRPASYPSMQRQVRSVVASRIILSRLVIDLQVHTGSDKTTCMTSPMIRRHEFAANGIHDFTCRKQREEFMFMIVDVCNVS